MLSTPSNRLLALLALQAERMDAIAITLDAAEAEDAPFHPHSGHPSDAQIHPQWATVQ